METGGDFTVQLNWRNTGVKAAAFDQQPPEAASVPAVPAFQFIFNAMWHFRGMFVKNVCLMSAVWNHTHYQKTNISAGFLTAVDTQAS